VTKLYHLCRTADSIGALDYDQLARETVRVEAR
jgi:hypothetical protein